MTSQVKKVLEQIERLPMDKQQEIIKLIEDELNWDTTFGKTQEQLSILAKEASQEFNAGKTSDKDW
jgi:hypothetical protein